MNNAIFTSMQNYFVYILAFLIVFQFVLLGLFININMKYNRMKRNYASFMKGKDGKNLEESIVARFEELDEIAETARENDEQIKVIFDKLKKGYQKVGIVKYDAFHEMGGNLSFVLTMLDDHDDGWIFNAMHSREGCYTYIKEVVKGESYIELAQEEKECLAKAIFQEEYDIKGVEIEE